MEPGRFISNFLEGVIPITCVACSYFEWAWWWFLPILSMAPSSPGISVSFTLTGKGSSHTEGNPNKTYQIPTNGREGSRYLIVCLPLLTNILSQLPIPSPALIKPNQFRNYNILSTYSSSRTFSTSSFPLSFSFRTSSVQRITTFGQYVCLSFSFGRCQHHHLVSAFFFFGPLAIN